jgi:hypothetical protein
MCPLVVLFGVNNHNHSIVFCGVTMCKETKETYAWLLEQLLSSMGWKSSTSGITDENLTMKNVIRRVFLEARHRLCV